MTICHFDRAERVEKSLNLPLVLSDQSSRKILKILRDASAWVGMTICHFDRAVYPLSFRPSRASGEIPKFTPVLSDQSSLKILKILRDASAWVGMIICHFDRAERVEKSLKYYCNF